MIYNNDYMMLDAGMLLTRLQVNKQTVNELHAALTWVRYKTIYRFDDDLSELLSK